MVLSDDLSLTKSNCNLSMFKFDQHLLDLANIFASGQDKVDSAIPQFNATKMEVKTFSGNLGLWLLIMVQITKHLSTYNKVQITCYQMLMAYKVYNVHRLNSWLFWDVLVCYFLNSTFYYKQKNKQLQRVIKSVSKKRIQQAKIHLT